jgi:DNA-binding beta-propeller fold protein YncE
VAGEAECTTGAVVRDCCSAPKAEAHLYLAHLSGGEVSFLTSDAKGVQLKDSRGGFFNDKSGIRGGFALAPQLPGASQGLVYVSSRVNSVLASFLVDGESRIIDATRAPVGVLSPGDDVRGIAFGPGGRRLYVVDRAPAALVALDMTPGDDGLPRQEGLWAAEVCADPAMLRLGPDPTRPEEPLARLAYVVCFSAAQVFVVDTGLGTVVDQFLTGRGPNALVIDSPNRRGFLANFLDNTVGVIDLDPSHVTYNRMVLRLGREENLVHH